MQKFKVNGQSVSKIKWKQTDARMDKRTDRRTDGGDCITSHVNAVGKKKSVDTLQKFTNVLEADTNLPHYAIT